MVPCLRPIRVALLLTAPLIAADGLGLIGAGASPVRFGDSVGSLPFETILRL